MKITVHDGRVSAIAETAEEIQLLLSMGNGHKVKVSKKGEWKHRKCGTCGKIVKYAGLRLHIKRAHEGYNPRKAEKQTAE